MFFVRDFLILLMMLLTRCRQRGIEMFLEYVIALFLDHLIDGIFIVVVCVLYMDSDRILCLKSMIIQDERIQLHCLRYFIDGLFIIIVELNILIWIYSYFVFRMDIIGQQLFA